MYAPRLIPTVATIVEPGDRPRFDAAGQGCFAAIHTDSIPEAIRAVRERPVHAVLVSPRCVPPEALPDVASLVRGFPGVPTIAVVSRHDAAASMRLLALGASGVERVVDLSDRDGWRQVRELVSNPASPRAAAILARVIPALGEATPEVRTFFEVLTRLAPTVTTVRAFAERFRVRPSTLMSRFFRAKLPSPKRYLAGARIMYAAALFEEQGFTIADVAYRLDYSSPQSFGRHLRAVLGLTATTFRRRYGFADCIEKYCERLIIPFRATFHTFHPFNHHGMATLGHRR